MQSVVPNDSFVLVWFIDGKHKVVDFLRRHCKEDVLLCWIQLCGVTEMLLLFCRCFLYYFPKDRFKKAQSLLMINPVCHKRSVYGVAWIHVPPGTKPH